MRLPELNENLIGKVCVCSVGRPFIVTERKTFEFGEAWAGLGLDGKGTACSTVPAVVAESAKEFYDLLSRRFGGKMSHFG